MFGRRAFLSKASNANAKNVVQKQKKGATTGPRLKRLIQPEEIADAICFMITNAAVSGELWADAGWRPAT